MEPGPEVQTIEDEQRTQLATLRAMSAAIARLWSEGDPDCVAWERIPTVEGEPDHRTRIETECAKVLLPGRWVRRSYERERAERWEAEKQRRSAE
jgi:hypothetical protein